MHPHLPITAGSGFIGSHLANELLAQSYRVRASDNLCTQVHGIEQKRPAYLNPEVELQVGDVRDSDAVNRALRDIDAVYHLVPMVGVGQSIRHCFADISRARKVFGFEPGVSLEDGLFNLAEWLEGQIACDRVNESRAELSGRGLMG